MSSIPRSRDREAGPPVTSSLDIQRHNLTLGFGNMISRPATRSRLLEQPEPATREDPSGLALRCTHGRLRGAEGGFPQRFPPSRRGHLSFIVIPTAGGEASIATTAKPRIKVAGGGRPDGIQRGRPRLYEYGYDTLGVGARNGPWERTCRYLVNC